MCAKTTGRNWKLRVIWHTITHDLSPLADGLKQLLASEKA